MIGDTYTDSQGRCYVAEAEIRKGGCEGCAFNNLEPGCASAPPCSPRIIGDWTRPNIVALRMIGALSENDVSAMLKREAEVALARGTPQPVASLPPEAKPRYNHMYAVAFSLENESPDGEETTPGELLDAMEKRVRALRRNPEEILEACGMPDNTYEVPKELT